MPGVLETHGCFHHQVGQGQTIGFLIGQLFHGLVQAFLKDIIFLMHLFHQVLGLLKNLLLGLPLVPPKHCSKCGVRLR